MAGPGQLYVGNATTTAIAEWTLVSITTSTVTLTASLGNLAQVTYCTTGTMAGFTTAWTAGNSAWAGEPWLPGYNCPPPPTDAQRAAWRREAELNRRRSARVRARARELLLSVLDEEQARDYTGRGFFELRGSGGGWWRVRDDGQAGNVDELERPGGPRVATWCCHPPDGLPDADAHLAQLLHIATDEPGFRQTGNRRDRRHELAAAA